MEQFFIKLEQWWWSIDRNCGRYSDRNTWRMFGIRGSVICDFEEIWRWEEEKRGDECGKKEQWSFHSAVRLSISPSCIVWLFFSFTFHFSFKLFCLLILILFSFASLHLSYLLSWLVFSSLSSFAIPPFDLMSAFFSIYFLIQCLVEIRFPRKIQSKLSSSLSFILIIQ